MSNWKRPKCECGHADTTHSNFITGMYDGKCKAKGCGCKKFKVKTLPVKESEG